jgi:hypothetical protein
VRPHQCKATGTSTSHVKAMGLVANRPNPEGARDKRRFAWIERGDHGRNPSTDDADWTDVEAVAVVVEAVVAVVVAPDPRLPSCLPSGDSSLHDTRVPRQEYRGLSLVGRSPWWNVENLDCNARSTLLMPLAGLPPPPPPPPPDGELELNFDLIRLRSVDVEESAIEGSIPNLPPPGVILLTSSMALLTVKMMSLHDSSTIRLHKRRDHLSLG